MAKRRRIEAPSADDLSRIEEEFRRETGPRRSPSMPPIAHVAAESASAMDIRPAAERTAAARDQADAERFRDAAITGRLMQEIPLAEIDPDSMLRDRMVMDEAELQELANSIAAHGLRLPVELYDMGEAAGQGPRYGLLSGYRRYLAIKRLGEMTGGEKFVTIKAVVRDPEAMGGSFVAMVEENEVRATISPYERGRIAVIAAQSGAFVNAEAAVDTLFATASKAKRSKIRSFAQVFEELGDLLRFPESLSEKQGLRLATELRSGGEHRLRDALEAGQGESFEDEWALLEAAMSDLGSAPVRVARGGRPRKEKVSPGWSDDNTLRLSSGWRLTRETDARSPLIRIEGRTISAEVMEKIMESIRLCLEAE